ncbi:hypothetical protein HNQ50_000829 [Silvimonas terrae]|uniref:Ice-binding protein C-terminal domain-containing protein n=1 Tax=Silvimonas terrae TaxID=300266 RepID=A0A840R9S6_9NEIS|nr:PEP-CTERM sorting domain-containing protein [Silvimonas terrae]MBB5190119.1 hypothetical protein [Silvimonas terrae]
MNRTLAGLVLALCAGAVSANTYTFSAADTGWVGADGFNNGSNALNNYFAGYCSTTYCTASPSEEYRNFFQFDTAGLVGKVTSAVLQINLHDVQNLQSPQVNYVLTALTGTSFDALGAGTVYGVYSGGPSDANQWVDISLDAASFAAIASGQFGLGGRITDLQPLSTAAQYLFGYSGQSDQGRAQLLVTTSPVPEPETWALLLIGSVAVVARRKRSAATAC